MIDVYVAVPLFVALRFPESFFFLPLNFALKCDKNYLSCNYREEMILNKFKVNESIVKYF